MSEMDDDILETALTAARSAAMRPAPDALLARIAADAEAELAWRRRPARARRGLRALLADFGGWPGLGGLATAAAIGVWIGVAMPSAVQALGLPLVGGEEDLLALLLPDYELSVDWEG